MNVREIVLDTETTGLNPHDGHRIVEIGALEMVDKVLTGKKFHFYINPQRDMPNEAYKIHGISSDFLKDKPVFREVADEFLEFIEDGNYNYSLDNNYKGIILVFEKENVANNYFLIILKLWTSPFCSTLTK